MTEIQSKLLSMLLWFDSFCRANGLRYYALGGTLLGAVRHEGFIPWDDDVDVGMPRADYERLAELLGSEIHPASASKRCPPDSAPSGYVLETEQSPDPQFCYFFSKLYDTSTTLRENVSTGLTRGLFLDVFPLDGLGSGPRPDFRHFGKIRRRGWFYLARVTSVRKGRSPLKNLAVTLAKRLPSRLVDDAALRKSIGRLAAKYDFDRSAWAGSLLEDLSPRSVVPRRLFGSPADLSFEGHRILGPEHPEEFLSALFGDWRQLPPESARVSSHDFLSCDLHKSYLE